MAPKSYACRSLCANLPINPAGKYDELAGAQNSARRSNVRSDEAPTKAFTSLGAPTWSFVPSFTKDLFIRFMKVFMETTQAQAQALAKP